MLTTDKAEAKSSVYQIVVTFDLHGASKQTQVYASIKADLATIELKKSIRVRSELLGLVRVKLPSNTFVGSVSVDTAQDAKDVRNQVIKAVSDVIRRHKFPATVFVSVGAEGSRKRFVVRPLPVKPRV